MRKNIKIGSNRSFGIVFFIIFLLIGLLPLLNENEVRIWAILICFVFLILGVLNSKILTPLNKIWFKFGISNSFFRHIFKTFSWRIIGTIDTIVISLILTERIDIAFKIGFFEIITKMILYYCHEKLWYKSKFGLNG